MNSNFLGQSRSKLRRFAKPIFVAIIALGLAVTCELAATLVGLAVLHETRETMKYSREEVRSFLPDNILGSGSDPSRDIETPIYNNPRRAHPYFGFTYDDRRYNNMGFRASADYPYRKRPGEFVVGIFGGSVAMMLAHREATKALSDGIAPSVKPKGYERVTILNFAQGGYRQPQTIFTFIYFLDSLDAAIFLDGYNEIAQLPTPSSLRKNDFPLDFPVRSVYKALYSRNMSPEQLRNTFEVLQVRRNQHRLLAWASSPIIRQSMAAQFAWRISNSHLEAKVGEIDGRLSGSATRLYPMIDRTKIENDEISGEFFRVYADRIRSAWAVGKEMRKPVLHFVQPNQYVPGSKIFTPKEKQIAIGGRKRTLVLYYKKVQEMSAELNKQGIPSYDLTMMFKDNNEILYRDKSSHLFPRGMILIAEAIVEEFRSSKFMEMIPAVEKLN